jgi:hypothetical protein
MSYDHSDQRLEEIQRHVREVPDDELQRLIDSTWLEVTRVAQAALSVGIGGSPSREQHPLARQLEMHGDAKERVFNILEGERNRRKSEKDLVTSLRELPEQLRIEPSAMIVDRLWHLKHYHNTNREPPDDVYQVFANEANRRGLNVSNIERMTEEDVARYIDTLL